VNIFTKNKKTPLCEVDDEVSTYSCCMFTTVNKPIPERL